MLTVYALPPVWGTPSPSPFAIKLLTWLRLAGIEHDFPVLTSPPRSRTGKIPYVELQDGTQLCDSGLIIEELTRRFSVELDLDLSPVQLARAHAIRRLCEDHLYFVGAWERWIQPEGYEATSRDYFAHLPAAVSWLAPPVLRGKMRKNLHGHGLGRLSPEEIEAAGQADLAALAELVEAPFVFGERPHGVDATVYGMLAAFASHPFPSALRRGIEERPKLQATIETMRAQIWA